MKYPGAEVRTARAKFTEKLLALVEKLDKCSTQDVAYPAGWYRAAGVETLTVKALWVVGSYARGASHCGDLDLVMDAPAVNCPRATLCQAFLGKPRDVRTYLGTPDENGSGVEHPDAKLVWAPGLDWRAAIAAIKEDSLAGRFARDSDAIPVRTEQLHMYPHTREELLAAHKAGLLEWSFIPLESLVANKNVSWRVGIQSGRLGKERLALLPYVQGYMDTKGRPAELEHTWCDGMWSSAGVQVHIGRAGDLRASALDDPKWCEVAFMPTLSIRGPNGIWVIKRGPNHPLRKVADQLKGWVGTFDGKPCISEFGHQEYSEGASVLGVFPTKEIFDEYEQLLVERPEDAHKPVFLTGEALLEALAGCDGLEVHSKAEAGVYCSSLAFWSGERILGSEDWAGEDLRGADLPQRLAALLA